MNVKDTGELPEAFNNAALPAMEWVLWLLLVGLLFLLVVAALRFMWVHTVRGVAVPTTRTDVPDRQPRQLIRQEAGGRLGGDHDARVEDELDRARQERELAGAAETRAKAARARQKMEDEARRAEVRANRAARARARSQRRLATRITPDLPAQEAKPIDLSGWGVAKLPATSADS